MAAGPVGRLVAAARLAATFGGGLVRGRLGLLDRCGALAAFLAGAFVAAGAGAASSTVAASPSRAAVRRAVLPMGSATGSVAVVKTTTSLQSTS